MSFKDCIHINFLKKIAFLRVIFMRGKGAIINNIIKRSYVVSQSNFAVYFVLRVKKELSSSNNAIFNKEKSFSHVIAGL